MQIEGIDDLEAELLACAVDHCGSTLHSDDPLALKRLISKLSSGKSSRASYFVEAVTDIKNNKSRRVQSSHGDVSKTYRKWLGSIKTSMSAKSG